MILAQNNALNTRALNGTGGVTQLPITAGLTHGAINSHAINGHTSTQRFTATSRGLAQVLNAVTTTNRGLHNQGIYPFITQTHGCYRIYNAVGTGMVGAASHYNAATGTMTGLHGTLATFTTQSVGLNTFLAQYTNRTVGLHQVRNTHQATSLGLARWLNSVAVVTPGLALAYRTYYADNVGLAEYLKALHTKAYRQGYRVADDSLERWELYVGQDAMPSFEAYDQPVATGTSLPVSWPVPVPGAGETITLYVVARKRNKYNLLSHNQHPTLIEIDETTAESYGPLTAPSIIRVMDGNAAGALMVNARYPYGEDRNEADTWELYAEDGVDPDPNTDTAVATAAFGIAAGEYTWRPTVTGLTPGSTYHVMVVVRRTVDDATAQSAVTQFQLAEAFDLNALEMDVFAGKEYEVSG